MYYDEPKNLLESRLNEILKTERDESLMDDILRLSLMKSARKNESQLALVEAYELLGADRFVELISLMGGREVKFPSKEDFRTTVLVATTYYLKDICGMNWNDIKSILSDPTLNTVRIGINDSQLSSWLDEQIRKRMKEEDEGK